MSLFLFPPPAVADNMHVDDEEGDNDDNNNDRDDA